MPLPFPYFYCSRCGVKIVFPYPTHEESTLHQSRLPKDTWQAYFVCSSCSVGSRVTAQDVRLAMPHRGGQDHWGADRSFYRVRFKCAHKSCGSLVTVFVSTTAMFEPQKIEQIARHSAHTFACAHHHPMNDKAPLDSVVEVFSLL
jgi:hypothetical protein